MKYSSHLTEKMSTGNRTPVQGSVTRTYSQRSGQQCPHTVQFEYESTITKLTESQPCKRVLPIHRTFQFIIMLMN